jgi:hypothetical protein
MPGGPELLIILIVIAVPVAIVVAVKRFGGTASTTATAGDTSTIRLTGDGRAWLVAVAGDLHQLNAHEVEWLSADVLQVHWRHRSGWTIVIAILFFPIGLLALASRVSAYGTIAVIDNGPESTIRLGGEFSNAAIDVVNRHVPD